MSLASHVSFPSGGHLGRRRRPPSWSGLVFSSAFAVGFAAILVGLAAFALQRDANTGLTSFPQKTSGVFKTIIEKPHAALEAIPDFSNAIPSPTVAQLSRVGAQRVAALTATALQGPAVRPAAPLGTTPHAMTPQQGDATALARPAAPIAPTSEPAAPVLAARVVATQPASAAPASTATPSTTPAEPPTQTSAARPPAARTPAPTAPEPAATAPAPGRATSKEKGAVYALYLGAPTSQAGARAALGPTGVKYASLLQGRRLTFHGVRNGGGFAYRLRVGRLAHADADALCARVKAASGICDVDLE